MDDIADLDELRRLLASLAERKLVVYLSEPGRRGTIVTHGFHTSEELTHAKARFASGAAEDPAPASRPPSAGLAALEARLDDAVAEIAKLKDEVAALRARLGP
jgi:uncharacterized protein YceH (UPF0502 family)